MQPSTPDAAINVTDAFRLHSRPKATRKILLDFDGHTVTGSAWNAAMGKATITSPPYDKVCCCCVSTQGLAKGPVLQQQTAVIVSAASTITSTTALCFEMLQSKQADCTHYVLITVTCRTGAPPPGVLLSLLTSWQSGRLCLRTTLLGMWT